MKEKKAIFLRVILISSLILLAAVAIFIKLLTVQAELSDSVALNDPIIQLGKYHLQREYIRCEGTCWLPRCPFIL